MSRSSWEAFEPQQLTKRRRFGCVVDWRKEKELPPMPGVPETHLVQDPLKVLFDFWGMECCSLFGFNDEKFKKVWSHGKRNRGRMLRTGW